MVVVAGRFLPPTIPVEAAAVVVVRRQTAAVAADAAGALVAFALPGAARRLVAAAALLECGVVGTPLLAVVAPSAAVAVEVPAN